MSHRSKFLNCDNDSLMSLKIGFLCLPVPRMKGLNNLRMFFFCPDCQFGIQNYFCSQLEHRVLQLSSICNMPTPLDKSVQKMICLFLVQNNHYGSFEYPKYMIKLIYKKIHTVLCPKMLIMTYVITSYRMLLGRISS